MIKMWKYITGALVAGSLTYGLARYFAGGVCYCKSRLDGFVVVITGANSGIGKALALELAKRGAILILACRDHDKAVKAKEEINAQLEEQKCKSTSIHVKQLDLASINSIIEFSESMKKDFKEIDALVNNAGIFYHPHLITSDKYEITYQTNYLGPFILTHLLLDLIKKSSFARIINVVSEAHRSVDQEKLLYVTNRQAELHPRFLTYGASKLALVLFTKHLSQKLINTRVVVNSVEPGNVETNIFRHFPYLKNKFLYAIQWPIRLIAIKTPKQGAQTALHCLLTTDRLSGQYYRDCKLSASSALGADAEFAKQYYNQTIQLLGDKFNTETFC